MLNHASLAAVVALGLFVLPADSSAQTVAAASSDPIIVEQVLVKINGEIITQTDLEGRQIAEIRGRSTQPRSNTELVRLIREVTPGVLAAAVDELLLVQRGRDLGYQLSDEQFEEILGNLIAENQFESNEEFEEALRESEGLTMSDLRRLMEHQMLVSQVQQIEILSRVAITDVEAREYYDTHADEFTEPATATLREILIAVPEAPAGFAAAGDEEARVVASTTVARLRGGEDFAALADELSDSPSKSNRGLIGPLLVSDFSDTIQQLMASLEVGGVADPIRTPQGYQVLMLEDYTEAVLQPFDQVRDAISSSVFSDRRLQEYADYLESLRAEAIIEWKNEELRQLYEQFRATQPEGEVASSRPGQN